MENKREQLVPSANLASFYQEKISLHLSIIYYNHERSIHYPEYYLKINNECDEIFKQIKNRLEKFELAHIVKDYKKLKDNISKLKPFKRDRRLNAETSEVEYYHVKTPHYPTYKNLVIDKEELLWKSLDELGLLGTVEIKGRRIR